MVPRGVSRIAIRARTSPEQSSFPYEQKWLAHLDAGEDIAEDQRSAETPKLLRSFTEKRG
jgi:hypothetical protein